MKGKEGLRCYSIFREARETWQLGEMYDPESDPLLYERCYYWLN